MKDKDFNFAYQKKLFVIYIKKIFFLNFICFNIYPLNAYSSKYANLTGPNHMQLEE